MGKQMLKHLPASLFALFASCQTSNTSVSNDNFSKIPVSLAFNYALEDDCHEMADMSKQVEFIKNEELIVRMIGDRCKTFSGKEGYKKGSSWIALGVPCSQGQAGIEWKGSYYRPDKVQFSIKNSCSFSKLSNKEIELLVREKLKIPKEFNFIAYVPLDTQYWKLSNYADQDLGVDVELLTDSSRQQGWNKFRRGGKLDVVLFGTENAWMKKKKFYRVDASLEPSADRVRFTISVNSARLATKHEITELKESCRKIIPSRPCDKLSSY